MAGCSRGTYLPPRAPHITDVPGKVLASCQVCRFTMEDLFPAYLACYASKERAGYVT